MRKSMLTTLCLAAGLAFAAPALATDSGDAAFDLLSKYTAEARQTDYIKLQSSIKMSDAKSIDAKISELYGTPAVTRAGLKVWEVANNSGTGAPHTTIMCGPDGSGGLFISADRRGPTSTGAASRSNETVSRKTRATAKPTRLRSQERD